MYSIYFHSSFQANSKTHTFSPIGHASSLNEGRNASTPPPSLQGSHKQPQTTSQASQFGTPMGSNLTAAPSSVRLRPFYLLLWNYKWFFLQLLILLWCWKIEQFADIDIFVPFFFFQTDTDGLPTLKSIAQEATNRAGLKVPLSQASTQQIQQMSAPPGSTASSISQSGMSFLPKRFWYKLKMCEECVLWERLLTLVIGRISKLYWKSNSTPSPFSTYFLIAFERNSNHGRKARSWN